MFCKIVFWIKRLSPLPCNSLAMSSEYKDEAHVSRDSMIQCLEVSWPQQPGHNHHLGFASYVQTQPFQTIMGKEASLAMICNCYFIIAFMYIS